MSRQKKPKKKKAKDPTAVEAKQEVDAVKGFIIVMVLLIVALGVFIFITTGKLSDFDRGIAQAKALTRGSSRTAGMGDTALEVRAYLKLMKESGDTLLIESPISFFQRSFGRPEVGIPASKVQVSPRRESVNRKEKYTDYSWVLTIRDVDRCQTALFLYDLESRSPKARTLELTMRRNRKKGDQSWDGTFRIGYRIPGTGN